MNFPKRGNSTNFDFPHMRIYTYNCVFPLVEMHPKMRISAVRIYTIFWCITACGDTQFNVNSFTRKSVFPRTRICTVLSELPHVETHKSMCKSAHGEHTLFHMIKKVNYITWIFTQVCVFPHAEMHAKLRIFQHSPFKFKRCQHRTVDGSSSYTIDQRWLFIYIHYLKHIYPQVS